MEAGKEIQFPPRNTHFLTIISGYGGSVVIQIVSHTMLLLKQENIVGTITATAAKGRRSTSDENAAGVVRNKALRGNVRSGNVPFSSFFFSTIPGEREMNFVSGIERAMRQDADSGSKCHNKLSTQSAYSRSWESSFSARPEL